MQLYLGKIHFVFVGKYRKIIYIFLIWDVIGKAYIVFLQLGTENPKNFHDILEGNIRA